MSLRRPALAVLAGLLTVALAACGGGAETSGGTTTITLGFAQRNPDIAQTTETSLLMGLPYAERAGIKVEFTGFDGSTPNLQALSAGQVDLTQNLGTGTLMSAVSRGRDLRAISSSITTNQLRLYTKPDSGIRTTADLRGRTVGVLSLQSETQLILESAVRQDAGLEPQDVRYVAVGNGADAFEQLASGNVEALYTGDDAAVLLRKRTEIVEVPSPALEQRGFVTATVVPATMLTEDRDLLVRYLRAWAQGVAFAKANPEAAVRVHWEQFPQSKPVGVSDEEALKTATEQLTIRLGHLVPFDGRQGDIDPATIQAVDDQFAAGGYLEGGALPIERFWDPQLLAEANDFDVAAVQEEARSWPTKG